MSKDRITADDLRLQAAGDPEGYAIEWITEVNAPVLTLYRRDEDGVRLVSFWTDGKIVDIELSRFAELLKRSQDHLDEWEASMREVGLINENGQRK